MQNAVFHVAHHDGIVGQFQQPGLFADLRLGFLAFGNFQLQIFDGLGQVCRLLLDHKFQPVPQTLLHLLRLQTFPEQGFDVHHAGEQQQRNQRIDHLDFGSH